MKCHYCGSTNVKPVVKKAGKVYLIECLEPQGNEHDRWCKYTTIPQIENCLVCNKEFEFRFDPGWKEYIVCWPCEKQKMKEYFDDPEFKRLLKEEIKKPNRFIESLPKEHGWTGGYIPIPLKTK